MLLTALILVGALFSMLVIQCTSYNELCDEYEQLLTELSQVHDHA